MFTHRCIHLIFPCQRRTFDPVALLKRERVDINVAEYWGGTPKEVDAAIPERLFCIGLFSSTHCGAPYDPTVTAVNPPLIANPHCPHGRNVDLRSSALSAFVCDSNRCFHPIAGCFIIAPCVASVSHSLHARSVVDAVGLHNIM